MTEDMPNEIHVAIMTKIVDGSKRLKIVEESEGTTKYMKTPVLSKNLFVSFSCCNEKKCYVHGCSVIPDRATPKNSDELLEIQKYIEEEGGVTEVMIINYKVM